MDHILADNDPPDGDNNECCLASIAERARPEPNWHGGPDTGALPHDFRRSLLAALATSTALVAAPALAQDCAEPIKVGVLHSLSGSMAISETTLRDVMLMLIEQQNAAGGVLGCELEAVVVDPASDWPLFAELTRQLLTVDEVDVIFGAWTSVSRKSALPVLEELNGLMFYPVQYEGEESSRNVFYTGAAPNTAGHSGGGLLP